MHSYQGIVRKGERRGSALGYPTANIALTDGSVDGIFTAVVTVADKQYFAAAFADPSRGILEVHLLDYFGDLYDQEITIQLQKKIREPEEFNNDEELKIAIGEDVAYARNYFKN